MSRRFLGVAALLFTISAAITTYWCTSMSAMGDMPMPGGWGMSMMWMRMPGQSWLPRRWHFPRYVARDDGRDDVAIVYTHALEVSRIGQDDRRHSSGLVDGARDRRLHVRLDGVGIHGLPGGGRVR